MHSVLLAARPLGSFLPGTGKLYSLDPAPTAEYEEPALPRVGICFTQLSSSFTVVPSLHRMAFYSHPSWDITCTVQGKITKRTYISHRKCSSSTINMPKKKMTECWCPGAGTRWIGYLFPWFVWQGCNIYDLFKAEMSTIFFDKAGYTMKKKYFYSKTLNLELSSCFNSNGTYTEYIYFLTNVILSYLFNRWCRCWLTRWHSRCCNSYRSCLCTRSIGISYRSHGFCCLIFRRKKRKRTLRVMILDELCFTGIENSI